MTLNERLRQAAGKGYSPYARHWYVHGNLGSDGTKDGSAERPFLTMAAVFARLEAGGRLGTVPGMFTCGHVIHVLGNISEHLSTPNQVQNVVIVGEGTRPRHADTHPGGGENTSVTWKSAGTNSPLITVNCAGWRFENILFAAHASNAAILLDRNATETAAGEIDASHTSVVGCRFASGGYGIRDIGGCFNVLVENNIFGAVTECILGVGNIGVGQLQWHIVNNHFNNFTNGVKIAAHECVVKDNHFTDGGTPATTYVLNLSNGAGRDNFIHDNFFQGTTANFNDPDIVGNATDVWMRNYALNSTAAGVGSSFEAGQPA